MSRIGSIAHCKQIISRSFAPVLLLWLGIFLFSGFRPAPKNPNVISTHFVVNGVCDQCKKRIEDATYIKGVKFANWSIETHVLDIRYDTTKTNADIILKAVADAGHDNEKYRATDAAYNSIPNCCRYRDKTPAPMK